MAACSSANLSGERKFVYLRFANTDARLWGLDLSGFLALGRSNALGDLRLECEVGMKAGLISDYPPSFFGWLDELLPQGPSYCHRAEPRYLFFAERPLFSVTLVDGARREVLSVDRLYAGASRDAKWKRGLRYCDCEALIDRAYFVPLGDESWPDDTRVEIEYMS